LALHLKSEVGVERVNNPHSVVGLGRMHGKVSPPSLGSVAVRS
jgi:hypothetical protein